MIITAYYQCFAEKYRIYSHLVRLVVMVLKLEEVKLTVDRKGKARRGACADFSSAVEELEDLEHRCEP